jgi:uncharacterized iron-regulated protein
MLKILIWFSSLAAALILGGCAAFPEKRSMMVSSIEITPDHYRIFDADGRPADLQDIVQMAGSVDAVFIGEEHDDPTGHYLESELLKQIHEYCRESAAPVDPARSLILSLEMFERDVQVILDEYLADLISERHFLSASRPWQHYFRNYRQMIEYARENHIPVIAANAPGRYVNRVSRLGRDALDALSFTAKSWLPPLPYGRSSEEYRLKFKEFWDETAAQTKPGEDAGSTEEKPAHVMANQTFDFENLLDAQSLWDSAMAHAIARQLEQNPQSLILNINGKFHSEKGLGIPEHLKKYRPGVRILIITMLSPESFPAFTDEHRFLGDFIILTDPKHQWPSSFHGRHP